MLVWPTSSPKITRMFGLPPLDACAAPILVAAVRLGADISVTRRPPGVRTARAVCRSAVPAARTAYELGIRPDDPSQPIVALATSAAVNDNRDVRTTGTSFLSSDTRHA